MSLDFTEEKEKSTLVAITWANVDPDKCRHMASLGHNELSNDSMYLLILRVRTMREVSTDIKTVRLGKGYLFWIWKPWKTNNTYYK